MRNYFRALAALFSVLIVSQVAFSQTRQFLDAKRIKERIRVEWRAEDKQLRYAIDGGGGTDELVKDTLFVTSGSIYVTYARFNPLRMQVTASVAAVDDPAQATVNDLIKSIASIASIINPSIAEQLKAAGGAGQETVPQCQAFFDARLRIAKLDNALNNEKTSPSALKKAIADWIMAIDSGFTTVKNGGQAVGAAIKLITELNGELETTIKNAAAAITDIDNQPRIGTDPTKPSNDLCAVAVDTVYRLARISYARIHLENLRQLNAALVALQESLEPFARPERWNGEEFKIVEGIKPTSGKAQNVTVTVKNSAFKVAAGTGAMTVTHSDAGSGTFMVRRHSYVFPEVAAGIVFGNVDTPRYATSKNAAGETIVKKLKDDNFSVNPGLMVNFVCRCNLGSVAPMFQVGTAVSKDVPAILTGAGLRLFGVGGGDLAIGGGLMLAWVKDLNNLKIDGVITGEKDILDDLKFKAEPLRKGYFTIQYKF